MILHEQYIENVVVGSGAAGFQTALRIHRNGEEVVVVTENITAGTSRNTGSDKQTYYKLSLAGEEQDSVLTMAQDLFLGQCVDGDMALCEAALSVQGFFRLIELGVQFPCTEYGEYMGYKTDHDKGRRATSAGPYTSKMMTECLEAEVKRQDISILDQMQVVRLLTENGRICGLVCLNREMAKAGREEYAIIWCRNLVMATGGPAGMYRDSVYPGSQLGCSGLAFEAGAAGKNLTEWQFGLASVSPRWNVSGTYMQVLPRFISTDREGKNAREFLLDYFDDPYEMLTHIFMKGYQWPFDVNKIFGGSSIIDLLVYQEKILKDRRIFLDFSKNTGDRELQFERLSGEAYEYLKNADALTGVPIDRLRIMNEPAIRFYLDHGINLETQLLEIAVCVQHNNGGLATDAHWETNIKGLFAVGEVCGSHGVNRPGGTALNAGQVGAIRASEKIHQDRLSLGEWEKEQLSKEQKSRLRDEVRNFLEESRHNSGATSPASAWKQASERMSCYGGMIREYSGIKKALQATCQELEHYHEYLTVPDCRELPLYFHLRDMLISQKTYLFAMLDYIQQGIGSRGSVLYTDPEGIKPGETLPEIYACRLDEGRHGELVQEVTFNCGQCNVSWRKVRPIPEEEYFFENQWKKYRERNG